MTTLPQTASARLARPIGNNGHLAIAGPMAGGAPAPHAMSGADVWRVLRANMWLILAMLVASIVIGYATNMWLLAKYSRYTSTGLVKVMGEDEIPTLGRDYGGAVNPATLEIEQRSQAELLTHERLLSAILATSQPIRQTDWFKQFISYKNGQQVVDAESAKQSLLEHLDVSPLPNSRLIKVRMSYSVPKDCQTIVQEVCDQHIKNMKEAHNSTQLDKAHSLDQLKLNYLGQQDDFSRNLNALAGQLGREGVSTNGPSSKDYELQAMLEALTAASTKFAEASTKLQIFDQQIKNNGTTPELEEALERSPQIADLRRQTSDADVSASELAQRLGETHPIAMGVRRRLDALKQKLADTESEVKARAADMVRTKLISERAGAEQAVAATDKRVHDIQQSISDLSAKRIQYSRVSEDLRDVRAKLEKVQDEQDKIGYLFGTNKWAVVDWATLPDLPDRPSFPKLSITLTVSIAIALALSLGIAFLRELTDTTVRSPRDIARVGQLSLLGMIPHESDDPQLAGARLALAIYEAPHSMIAEQFRQLRTRLQHTASLDTTRSILVAGCSPEDGTTTIAANLAAGLALNGRRILLVDSNFRRPGIHALFNTGNELGFGDVLNAPDHFEEAVRETEVPNLSVMPAGTRPSNSTELLESQLLLDFIERALEEYDHVIFDSGPMLLVSDTTALAPRVDGVISVVRARGNSRGLLQRMRDEIRKLKAEHLGVILNAVRTQGGGYYGPMIKNYYAYQNS